MRPLVLIPTLLLLALTAACVQVNVHGDPAGLARMPPLRVATYNTSLYTEEAGGLVRTLEGDSTQARKIAAVLQRVRPDVVLLNEFDYDVAHRAADLFQSRYLEVAQAGGGEALRYPYRYLAPANTGVPSGLDLDANGSVGATGRDRGNDAWGYGLHPGQYGMLVLSRFPIDQARARTFQRLRWSDMPGALRPRDPAAGEPFHDDSIWKQLRLSSKSHWDVPIQTPLGELHLLASHPTPPVFDGPEDRNGRRNFDEIRLWREYLSPGNEAWLCDDQGRCGGLGEEARFVIAGDLNADPADGDGYPGAITQLLQHPRINAEATPRSAGGSGRAAAIGLARRGDTATHTGDFGPSTGTLRLDYVLPSAQWQVVGSGIHWPVPGEPGAELIDASDHRLVWIDLR